MNLNRLTKKEILWLYNHRCKAHSHRYIEHIPCYLKETPPNSPIQERLGHLDIESSNLKASFGIMFSYCIKEDKGKILGRSVTPKEMKEGLYDRKLCEELVRDMRTFDKITVYYGANGRFDIPFIRSRCLHNDVDFPQYGELAIIDLYPVVKNKLQLHRNRLQTACDFLGIKSKQHPIKYNVWIQAFGGKRQHWALDYIFKHNKEDVVSLEALYYKLLPFMRRSNASV